MRTLKVYGYRNGQDVAEDDVPTATITFNDDETEIVSVESATPEEDESILKDYLDAGLTAVQAVSRLAGSYGVVKSDDAPSTTENETAEDDDTVTSAAEDEDVDSGGPDEEDLVEAPEGNPFGLADRITSGAVMALVDENGVVITLFQSDESGDFQIRLDGEWTPLADPRTIDGLTFVGVEEDALDLYDEHQKNGNLVPVRFYNPSLEGPYWSETIVTDDTEEGEEEVETTEEDEEALTAAITLNSPRDLDDAIAAALLNKDLRWYVERRIAALGLEADLPWSNS
jgi:hypothetical protein